MGSKAYEDVRGAGWLSVINMIARMMVMMVKKLKPIDYITIGICF